MAPNHLHEGGNLGARADVRADALTPSHVSTPAHGSPRPHDEKVATGAPSDLPAVEVVGAAVSKFLRSFQALILSTRLYDEGHSLTIAAAESAEQHLHEALMLVVPVAIRVDENSLSFHRGPGSARAKLEGSDMWPAIAQNWRRLGLRSLVFLPQTTRAELESLAHVLSARRMRVEEWTALLTSEEIRGIRANVRIQVQATTPVLATLAAALVAHGAVPADSRTPGAAPTLDDLSAALRVLSRLEPAAGADAPQKTAQELHAVLADAERRTLSQILGMMSRTISHENEASEQYLARLAEGLLLDTLAAQFANTRLPIHDVRNLFSALGDAIAQAISPAPIATRDTPLRDASAGNVSLRDAMPLPAALSRAAKVLAPNVARAAATEGEETTPEAYAELLRERFWDQMPAREKSIVLRGPDAWCVPGKSLERYIVQLVGLDDGARGDAPWREARIVLLNYSRALAAEEPRPRRVVAGTLLELIPLIERLWQDEIPAEIDRAAARSLIAETSPGISATLLQLVESLAQSAKRRREFSRFEWMLDQTSQLVHSEDAKRADIAAFIARETTGDAWRELVEAALAGNALDPALPRILRRDPTRLVEYLGTSLAASGGSNGLARMTELVRACGEPVFGALESGLYDARSQRAATAVKLLAAADPQRLVKALPRAMPGWEWNLQDMAVGELSRREGVPAIAGVARAFAAILPEAHEMVAPMMIDAIGIANETSAISLLMQIAAGELETQRDIFIRIKAVEALGRMKATQAAALLRVIVREHQGLAHVEPAGLRAAAEEALAMMENRPSSARVRAADESRVKTNQEHSRPRRYIRIPLERPFAARIEGAMAAKAGVSIISLGGAFIESAARMTPGEQLHLDIRAGLRHIRSTAIVRNISPAGGGVEFLHMAQKDRERLRRLVRKLQA